MSTSCRALDTHPRAAGRGRRPPNLWKPVHSQEWSISNFPCSLAKNITSRDMKNLAFHSLLRWKMSRLPILTTWLRLSLKRWENVLFELGSETLGRNDQAKYGKVHFIWQGNEYVETRRLQFSQSPFSSGSIFWETQSKKLQSLPPPSNFFILFKEWAKEMGQ